MRRHAKATPAAWTSDRGIGTLAFALVMALMFGLTISSAAQAARGVFNTIGNNGSHSGQFSFIRNSGSEGGVKDSVGGIDVNDTGNGSGANVGDIYVVDGGNNRIEQFSSTGDFIRAWGYDVVRSGEDNTGANEQQSVTVPATVTDGTFTLTVTTALGEGSLLSTGNTSYNLSEPGATEVRNYSTSFGSFHVGDIVIPNDVSAVEPPPVVAVRPDALILAYLRTLPAQGLRCRCRTRIEARETTAPIAFNAPATGPGSVQAALEALPGVGPGTVTVTGGPGTSNPFTISFSGGPFAGNDVPQIAATSLLTGGSASVSTAVAGGGIETCKAVSSPADVCKGGSASPIAGAMNAPRGIAVDQATGNLFVTDQGNRRVDAFGSEGSFQGAFGWGVDTGAAAFQFCTTLSVCQAPAAAGAAAGQFGEALGHPAVAPAGAPNAGNVLVADATNNRIDEFQPTLTAEAVTGATFVRGFGWDTIAGAPTTLESCTSACNAGTSGGGAGQFSTGAATAVAVDATGAIYALNLPKGTANCSPTARCGVQKFNPAATSASDFAPAQLTLTSGAAAKRAASAIAVEPGTGDVYVAQANETEPPESRVHRFDSAGNPLGVDLSGLSIGWQGFLLGSGANHTEGKGFTPVNGLAYDPSTGHTVLGTTGGDEQSHLFIVDDIPASAAQTLSASLDPAPVTAVTGDGATVSGSLTAAQGLDGSTRYEFEYTNGTTWLRTPLGDAGNGSGVGDPNSCPEGDPTSCNVSVELSDLEAGQDYKVRLHAYVPFNPDLSVTTPAAKFKIAGVGPSAETGNAWWSSPAATKPNLIMTGFVNPRNEVTTYYFQYVSEEDFLKSGFATASSAPAAPGDPAAQSFRRVEVQQTLYELDPGPAYRYRLVAVSPSGTAFGPDRSVESPNANGRFYELVSNGNSGGLGTGSATQISDQGNRALFSSQIFEGQTAAPTPVNPKVSQRTPSGWKVTPPALDPDHGYVGDFAATAISNGYQPSADLSKLLFEPTPGSIRESGNGRVIFEMANVDGTTIPATPLLEALTREAGVTGFGSSAQGGSADMSRLVIGTRGGTTLLPGETLTPRSKPYVVDTETLQLSLLNLDSGGNMIGGVCGAQLGGTVEFSAARTNAVSFDGSAMFFSARPGAPSTGPCSATIESTFRTRIFRRENETTTTEISASQCNRPALPEPPGTCKEIVGDDVYRAASADGEVVFFTTSRQLTNSDVDTAEDLYIYDSSPPVGQPTLVQATAGEATAGHPTVGSGAGFLGIVDFAADGSRLYFVSTSQLTATATVGQKNLYVFERDEAHPDGRIALVATLSNASGEFNLWGSGGNGLKEAHALPSAATSPGGGQVYGDGRFLVFVSATKLVPADTDSAKDLYRYSDDAGQLLCLSCSGNEEKAVGIKGRSLGLFGASNPGAYQQSRIASEDVSKVVFETPEGLDPDDHNGVGDAYMWDEGQLVWVSRDTGDFGSPRRVSNLLDSELPTISLDGKDVYFVTSARLVASEVDTDTGPDLYDARIGGGFPAPKPEARICADGEVCRGQTTASPPVGAAGSSTLAGPGNPVATKPRCRKGKVRRQGRCVSAKAKKKKQHKRSHERKAHRNARGSK